MLRLVCFVCLMAVATPAMAEDPAAEIQKIEPLPTKSDDMTTILKSIKRVAPPHRDNKVASHNPLMISEMDRIKQPIRDNWNIPSLKASSTATLLIDVARDGTVQAVNIPPRDQSLYAKDDDFRALVDSAKRAVWVSSPLKGLPADKYETWKVLEMNFNPDDAL